MTSILGSEWHLSTDGISLLTENGSIKDPQKILTLALNTDLKEIGSPVLTNELAKDKTSKIVLQIQKIRNVSAPKANEDSQAAPRMLKLNLTDGDSHVQALEISPINSISREHTPPGTKILLNNAKISSGYILLDSKNCTILGGKVPHLCEKWEIAKSIQRNKRKTASTDDGPPPWVNFGAKGQPSQQENDFKSLTNKNKEANKDNSEFELLRQGAIAEATSGAVRKVFGGRVKQNVQPITNNQRERQEKSKSRSKFTQKEREVEEKPLKPLEKVSLFSFLEDKLPSNDNQNNAKTPSATESQNYFKPQENSKTNGSQYKPYNTQSNPQREYQNYNQQNRKDYKQNSYKNEKVPPQNRYEQPNSFSKQYSKPNMASNNSSFVRYEKPAAQQRKYEDDASNSNKTYQGNSNSFQKDKNVNDLANDLNKLSVSQSINSQFATRSLRQHLNLGPPKKNEETVRKTEETTANASWNVGDECMAKYWEDGKFYNAIITAITEKTYAVKFRGYGNIEEVLKTDCLPVTSNHNKQHYGNQNQQNRRSDQSKPYSGSMEFRRSARNYK